MNNRIVCAAIAAAMGLLPALANGETEVARADAAGMSPGLAVLYYDNYFREIREVVEWNESQKGRPGAPLPRLDYRVGAGEVLTSGNEDAVGAHITGFIHLAEPGTYSFVAQSNDGVQVEIAGKRVLADPDVHADRFSDIGRFEAAKPGWYPLSIFYFERKNTATLELYWRPPSVGEGTMQLVPAEAFAHIPTG